MLGRKERTLVRWCPHREDRFVLASGSLNMQLFEVSPQRGGASAEGGGASTGSGELNTPLKLMDTIPVSSPVRCLAWSPDVNRPNLLATGSTAGTVSLLRFQSRKRLLGAFKPDFRACCNALAWNAIDQSKVAVGLSKTPSYSTLIFDITRAMAPADSNAPAASQSATAASAPSSAEEAGASNAPLPYRMMSIAEASTALEWFPGEQHVLGVGTYKWLRVFDTRTELKKAPRPVKAHVSNVLGLRFDPCQTYRLASHAEGQSVVKIWDTRKLWRPICQVDVGAPPSQVEWATRQPGLLSVTYRDSNLVQFWEVAVGSEGGVGGDGGKSASSLSSGSSSGSLPAPYHSRNLTYEARSPVSSISWHPRIPHRLLIATPKDVTTARVHNYMPLTWDAQGARVAFSARGDEVATAAVDTQSEGGSFDPEAAPPAGSDISLVMQYRANQGYGLDLMVNYFLCVRLKQRPLIKLWSWLMEIRAQHQAAVAATNAPHLTSPSRRARRSGRLGGGRTPSKAKAPAVRGVAVGGVSPDETSAEQPQKISSIPSEGVLSLILEQTQPSTHHTTPTDSKLGSAGGWFVPHYRSKARDRALVLCGWCPLDAASMGRGGRLEVLLRRLQQRALFRRAAALALFHLDVPRAIRGLVDGAEAPTQRDLRHRGREGGAGDKLVGAEEGSAEELQMAAIALAGYGTENGLWRATCQGLLQRLKSPYLRAALAFLSGDGSSEGMVGVMNELGMDMRDRVGFALRFLPDQALRAFLFSCVDEAISKGSLEGIVVTGVYSGQPSPGAGGTAVGSSVNNVEGKRTTPNYFQSLLQSYVDRTGDLQTAALLACYGVAGRSTQGRTGGGQRGVIARGAAAPLTKLGQWIDTYRMLLNQWRMWTERARLDVSRSLLARATLQSRAALASSARSDMTRFMPSSPAGRSFLSSRLAPTEPQIYMRCARCSQPLSVPLMPRTARAVFRRRHGLRPSPMKSRRGGADGNTGAAAAARTTLCPNCELPMPRCALCLATVDATTPYAVAARRSDAAGKDGVRGTGSSSTGADTASAHPFAQWFVWCQECRHGGHAGHMHEWFKTHSTCPVSNCNCSCDRLDSLVLSGGPKSDDAAVMTLARQKSHPAAGYTD